MPSSDLASRPSTVAELIKRYPVDDRARNFLEDSDAKVIARVLREFKPKEEGEADYSALLMTFTKRMNTADRPGPYNRVPGLPKKPVPKTNREKTCPFLLRIFCKTGGFHQTELFQERGKEPVDDELQVYTWPDVTLRELVDLIKDVEPLARQNTAKLQFRLIYPDKNGKNVGSEIGTVSLAKPGIDDGKALSSTKFQTGDMLDLAIHV
mmetsp:Transcript_33760/g.53671  ORF Transcript_33760/g.53671 Transcript_33760/m.53671 type:complete len:209 (+) Transcript_33760:97-723(+)